MPIRLLHLSDIHFGHEDKAAVEAAAAFAATTKWDLMVITGDITQWGAHEEFAAASAWLASIPGPRLATPGNHDTPWMGLLERATRPWVRYARTIGAPEAASFETPEMAVHATNSARGWQVRLDWSKGEVSRRQALEVSRRFQTAPSQAVRVLACHHPLREAEGEPITARVRGGRFAAERFTEAGVDIILSGHLHMAFVEPLRFGDERTYAVGAGTLSMRLRHEPPGFNVIDIDGDRLRVTDMAWVSGALAARRVWNVTLRPRGASQG